MKLIRSLDSLHLAKSVITIGNFDGIHLGHQRLLQQLQQNKIKYELPSVVIIFEPQPLEYFLRHKSHARLMTIRQKLEKFSCYDIDYVVCLKFNPQLANLDAEIFIRQILMQKLNVNHLIIGDDFSFGRNCSGDFSLLKQYADKNQFQLTKIDTMRIGGFRVSSSLIREALATDDFAAAARLLGHRYTMSGKVAHGDRRGRELGFPTANIYLRHNVMPITGVFITKIWGLTKLPLTAITNIGQRPTFTDGRFVLEAHIIDFNRNIYGKRIEVEFLHKIRSESKFSSAAQLTKQIELDILSAKKFISSGTRTK